MGGPRKEILTSLFSSDPYLSMNFDLSFSPGIPQRSIRNRAGLLEALTASGLLLLPSDPSSPPQRGLHADSSYADDFWLCSRSLGRDRTVLACFLAHLIAMKTATAASAPSSSSTSNQPFDIILEDNVRVLQQSSGVDVASTIRKVLASSTEDDGIGGGNSGGGVAVRYFGYLGPTDNVTWVHKRHIPKYSASTSSGERPAGTSPFPYFNVHYTEADSPLLPTVGEQQQQQQQQQQPQPQPPPQQQQQQQQQDKKKDKKKEKKNKIDNDGGGRDDDDDDDDRCGGVVKDGEQEREGIRGTSLWGAYAYGITSEGYDKVITRLQSDIGAIFWKSKGMKSYKIKPIDKVVPRILQRTDMSVQISNTPVFFRAPMLKSTIHSKWDAAFCRSTTRQLQCVNLSWTDLVLTIEERETVLRFQDTGEWVAPLPPPNEAQANDVEEDGGDGEDGVVETKPIQKGPSWAEQMLTAASRKEEKRLAAEKTQAEAKARKEQRLERIGKDLEEAEALKEVAEEKTKLELRRQVNSENLSSAPGGGAPGSPKGTTGGEFRGLATAILLGVAAVGGVAAVSHILKVGHFRGGGGRVKS